MDIPFMAGTTPVTLSRHWFTGAMLLQSATEKVWVQHPLHPGTHFSFSLVQSWLRHIAGHEVLVERTGRCCSPASARSACACWWMACRWPNRKACRPT
ncbi:hypothetical protein [Stenotrophomonas geniculata]|uniref:hypothetical protein n=1 Tax=Stenotrophomonas geniculata TaxID=86188 RepID=UPI000A4457B0|nr:hypothetical protein [Stenotrophomonas geniculata]